MKTKRTDSSMKPVTRWLSVFLMAFCLLFLTSVNYFLYPQDKEITQHLSSADDQANDYPPSGPTEEKSTEGCFSILEEFLHESHSSLNFDAGANLLLHHMQETSYDSVFHGELIAPPPKL